MSIKKKNNFYSRLVSFLQALNSPELLYNLFSFYGDVVRIKIIRRKTDCALIEFTTATFAAIARDYIDNLVFKGTQLVVSFSRFKLLLII